VPVHSPLERVLKHNLNRTLLLVRARAEELPTAEPVGESGEPVDPTASTTGERGRQRTLSAGRNEGPCAWLAIKQYHAQGILRRLGDGKRAQRELRALSRARELGLPVPQPIEVRQRDGVWELVTEFIEGAQALDSCLRQPELSPIPMGELARGLAGLLSRIVHAGMRHADLHPGNVLVDPSGKLWLLDLARARFLEPGTILQDPSTLVAWVAEIRDITSPQFRARVLTCLRRQLDPQSLLCVPNSDREVESLEVRARRERTRAIKKATGKWLRLSSATRIVQLRRTSTSAAERVVVRADVDTEEALVQLNKIDRDGESDGMGRAYVITSPTRHAADSSDMKKAEATRRVLHHAPIHASQAHDLWSSAVRLQLHSIPCARPFLFALEGPSGVVLELPADSCALKETAVKEAKAPVSASHSRRRIAVALGHWLARLHCSGLSLGPAEFDMLHWSRHHGRVYGHAAHSLPDADAAARDADCKRAAPLAMCQTEVRAFVAAYTRHYAAGWIARHAMRARLSSRAERTA
jgi:hypothetical protein